ncbi:MAG: class GN sortase [Alphaproteobacteria bacterium]|nr:class GN sortase [Alphaproteobacteria bacterium]
MSRVVAVAAPAARKWAAIRKRAVLALAALLIAISAVPFAGAGWIHAKAVLAQVLLERSWQARLNGAEEGAAKPWPWADTTPVARLQVPRLEVDQIVLAGASGRSLAFGPGHLTGTALPGERGNSVITGHRDTHFNFIGELRTGDTFRVQRPDGTWARYRVSGGEVVDARTAQLVNTPDRSVVTLVTCWPFNSRDYNQPWRYAVFGEEIEEG